MPVTCRCHAALHIAAVPLTLTYEMMIKKNHWHALVLLIIVVIVVVVVVVVAL